MKQILRHTLTITGALCLTIGGITAQPSSFASKRESFKTQYILGVNFVPEWQLELGPGPRGGVSENGFAPNVGLSFEARITRHSGIETGFYYRNVKFPAGVTTDGLSTPYPASYQRYFSIPILYKYYSRIVNLGVGFTYDFMFDHTIMYTNSECKEQDKNRFGVMVKVSKDITLYKGLFLEPEFHFNPFMSDSEWNKTWIGFTLGVKYRF